MAYIYIVILETVWSNIIILTGEKTEAQRG